jgi:hypothetical protein
VAETLSSGDLVVHPATIDVLKIDLTKKKMHFYGGGDAAFRERRGQILATI